MSDKKTWFEIYEGPLVAALLMVNAVGSIGGCIYLAEKLIGYLQ